MAKVIWTEPALQDLDDIAEYIALDKISAAKKLIRSVFKTSDRLKQFPKLGRKPPELDNSRYLELVINPCRIIYRIEKENVFILFVIRSERKLKNYILEERATKIG